MTLALSRLSMRLARRLRREDGAASMEFVLMVPVVFAVFMASFESGLLMLRHTMLDRAVDMTVRELRLGHFENPTHALLKDEICARAIAIPDCGNTLKLELNPVDTSTWTMPAAAPTCADRAEEIEPVVAFNPGNDEEEVMLVRACVVADAIFPTTGIALGLSLDGQGGYRLIAQSAFVNEP